MYKEDLSYGLFLSDRQLDFLSNYPQGFDRMKCFATYRTAEQLFLRFIVSPVGILVIRQYETHITHVIIRSSNASRLTTKTRMLL